FKPTVDHHAIVDPGIKLDLIPTHHLLQHPADNLLHIPAQPDHGADPAHPHVDGNQSASADGSNAHPGKVPHDPPAPTAPSSDLTGDDSAQPLKTNSDRRAVDDPETNSPSNSNNHPLQPPADNSLHTLAQPDDGPHPADPPVDVSELPNFKFANNDSAHPGTVVPHDSPTLTTLSSDPSGTH